MVDIWNALFRAINSVTSKYDPLVSVLLERTDELNETIKKLQSKIVDLEYSRDYSYQGRELSEFTWKELNTIAKNGTASENNIHIGDYKTITMNGIELKMQIAGIDTYYGTRSPIIGVLGHHIDFISKDCYPEEIIWNSNGSNNGTQSERSPYRASEIYNTLNTTLYNFLPDEVKSVIIEKHSIYEDRHNSNETLSHSNGYSYGSLGKLWIPSEFEVFGAVVCGTPQYSSGQTVQYPLFSNSWMNRAKKGSGSSDESTLTWLLCTVYDGDASSVCNVNDMGSLSYDGVDYPYYTTICFRIGQETKI